MSAQISSRDDATRVFTPRGRNASGCFFFRFARAVHGSKFCLSKPLNTTQLIGAWL
jgi:hypothetical protein